MNAARTAASGFISYVSIRCMFWGAGFVCRRHIKAPHRFAIISEVVLGSLHTPLIHSSGQDMYSSTKFAGFRGRSSFVSTVHKFKSGL